MAYFTLLVSAFLPLLRTCSTAAARGASLEEFLRVGHLDAVLDFGRGLEVAQVALFQLHGVDPQLALLAAGSSPTQVR